MADNRAKNKQLIISFVIVNFNVKEYLAQAISSIERAVRDIAHEIIVVDNASVDGSVQYLVKHFPEVKLIRNSENVGFGKANNQALSIACGEYIVLINPDTVVQEDTFNILLDFFTKTPEAGAATCKIINPDGTFSIDCRHSIPTPTIALWKVLGLSKLFPKSRLFGQYNLTFLDPDHTYIVPAISGSFMMIIKEVLKKVGFFDERFFMYCEDIDLCHRINKKGFKIYYVPKTQIIHYKGESTKRDNLDYVITFNRSLYQFFKKYYAPSSIFIFRWLVTIGIYLRGFIIFLKNFLRLHFPLILDLFILNSTILLSFVARFQFERGFLWTDYFSKFWTINLIASGLFLFISFYLDIYPNHRLSVQSITKANIITFILLASLTFFLKQFGFSRMVVLMTFIVSPALMFLWRILLRRFYRSERTAIGKDLLIKPTILVGEGDDIQILYKRLRARKDMDYELVGWVSVDPKRINANDNGERYLGALTDLKEIIKIHRIRQVIFSANSISYEQILKTMSSVSRPMIEYKMVPSNLEVIIGKSHIERLDDYPLLDIDYSIGKGFNRIIKRIEDVTLTFPLLVFLMPLTFVSYLKNYKNIESYEVLTKNKKPSTLYRSRNFIKNFWFGFWIRLLKVFIGQFSLVGAPIIKEGETSSFSGYLYKPGLTGLVQINSNKITSPDDAEKYHLFYLKNQSVLLDFEILVKTLVNWVFRK